MGFRFSVIRFAVIGFTFWKRKMDKNFKILIFSKDHILAKGDKRAGTKMPRLFLFAFRLGLTVDQDLFKHPVIT
jgi:hypothetical protein